MTETRNHYNLFKEAVREFQNVYGIRPYCVLSCAGFSDEAIHLYHPADLGMKEPRPRYIVMIEEGRIVREYEM